MDFLSLFPPQVLIAFRYISIAGFLIIAVLLISLNHKAFSLIFKEKTTSYWWLFTLLTIVPLLIFLYIFGLFFGRL